MKILHTADWHLGQTFYDNDRTNEQQAFLNWLLKYIVEYKIDAVLVSGDIYDNANPSNKAISMLYEFIQMLSNDAPNTQVIFTAGNHDSALRIEQPKPLLQNTNITLIGSSKVNTDKSIRYEDVIIRLKNSNGPDVLCMAIPFLRLGDYPLSENGTYNYQEGVKNYYNNCYDVAKKMASNNETIIAMGHLHAQGIKINERDNAERDIIGGIEMISASDFPEEIAYVALGHIHKAQKVGGFNHIRYCGSPYPLSFSEKNYKHQVLVLDIDTELRNVKSIDIPLQIPLITVPKIPLPYQKVMQELDILELELANLNYQPYVEVLIDITELTPNFYENIKQKFETINAKLVKISSAKKIENSNIETNNLANNFEYLDQLKPIDFITKIINQKSTEKVSESYLSKINDIINIVSNKQS